MEAGSPYASQISVLSQLLIQSEHRGGEKEGWTVPGSKLLFLYILLLPMEKRIVDSGDVPHTPEGFAQVV